MGLLMFQPKEKHQAEHAALYATETIPRDSLTHIPHFTERTGKLESLQSITLINEVDL